MTPNQCIKRDAIICASARIFCRDGFHGASIDLIANEAGVSRQTIYNHYRDKEALLASVVEHALERINANLFSVLATFPESGENLEDELVAFAVRLTCNCLYDQHGDFLRKLLQEEGPRLPIFLQNCRSKWPEQTITAIAARLSRLALAGDLDVQEPQLAARHFMALVNADIHYKALSGTKLTDTEIAKGAAAGVRTFLRAFGTAPLKARQDPTYRDAASAI